MKEALLMMGFSVAVCQMPVCAQKSVNLECMEAMVESAVRRRANVVTLPEMFICPYDVENFRTCAEEEGGPVWQRCSDIARKKHIYLSAGTIPERDADGRIYNTAYFFDPEGRQIAKHRKMHLFDIDVKGGQYFKESSVLSAGDQITVFDTNFGRFGLCICYDVRFPELVRLMALKGARVIFVPAAFNMTTGPMHWELLFRSQAMYNQVYVIGTAPARDENSGYVSWGHSIVTGPWGERIAMLNHKPGIKCIGIDLSMADQARDEIPVLKHRRTDVYELKEIR